MGIGVGIIVLLGAALAGFVSTRPDRFRIERSAVIEAPADVVFALINDLREWPRWSPWETLDPTMKRTYDGPPAGVGAGYGWSGTGKAGEGRMVITDSRPSVIVGLQLVFRRPFAATNETRFELTPADGGTRVSWIMEGKNLLASKAMSLVMNMDNLVGRDFERGLSNMRAAAHQHRS